MRHQLWSNFCDPHWELICCEKWHPGSCEISTWPGIAVGVHFLAQHSNKTIPLFLPAHGEAAWSLFPVLGLLTIRRHSATRKHLFPYPQGDRSGLRKPKKGYASTLITDTTSVHLPKPVSTGPTKKPDSVLTNQIGKDGVQSWSGSFIKFIAVAVFIDYGNL